MIEFKYNSPIFKLGKISRSEWRELGMSARSEIVKRTRNGVDINRQPFHKYSAMTQEYKSGIMQTRGLGSSVVTLQDTGQMHRSLSVEVQANAAILYYADQNRARVALLHQTGGYHLPKREHFGFNKTDSNKYLEKIAKLQTIKNKKANR